jgi:hypothetical protein
MQVGFAFEARSIGAPIFQEIRLQATNVVSTLGNQRKPRNAWAGGGENY